MHKIGWTAAFVFGVCTAMAGGGQLAADEPAPAFDPEPVMTLLELVIDADTDSARQCLAVLSEKFQNREIAGPQFDALAPRLNELLNTILAGNADNPLFLDAALLATTLQNPQGNAAARRLLESPAQPDAQRQRALEALIAGNDPQVLAAAARILADAETNSAALRGNVLGALGRLQTPEVADIVLASYQRLEPSLQPKAIELLTQRNAWSKSLLHAIGAGQIPATALNVNQVGKLLAGRDEELRRMVTATWGSVRTERNPQREQVLTEMRTLLRSTAGDPQHGRVAFQKLCGQCHKIYGEGQDVGPDITSNGRGSFEQLLSNVFDPSLVIGAAYQARTVITVDGRVLTGLLAEDNDERIVLKTQGGKLETIARADVDEVNVSQLSLMPEGVEQQLKPEEIVDLFAFLTLDRPPEDPQARTIPGTNEIDAARFHVSAAVHNLLVDATVSSNIASYGEGRRGAADHVIYDPQREEFLRPSQWHEDGVAFGKNLGVVTEVEPVYWLAEWKEPVTANLIALSGAYPNQPQPDTAWKIELRQGGQWQTLERGVGGWYDNGRFLWGGPAVRPLEFDAMRVSVFSKDDNTTIASIHFRGEPGISWVVAKVVAGSF